MTQVEDVKDAVGSKSHARLLRRTLKFLAIGICILLVSPPLLIVGQLLWMGVVQSTVFLRSFPSFCPAARGLPSSDRIIECSMSTNIDWNDSMSAKVSREEFERYVSVMGYGDPTRLTDPENYLFERTESEDGTISITESYGTRVYLHNTWEKGVLSYWGHSE